MARKGSAVEQTDQNRGAEPKIMEDGHPDPSRMGFWSMVDEISQRDLWDHYMIYGYRLEPAHTEEQKPSHAFKVSTPLTPADVAKQYGGYKWTLSLNRTVGGKNVKVIETRLDVKEPPIPSSWEQFVTPLPRLGVAGGSGPDQIVVLLSKMVEDLTKGKAEAEAAGRAFDPTEALNKSMTLLETGYKRALETANGPGSGLDLTKIIQLVTLLMPMIQQLLTPKQDPLTQAIMQRYINESAQPKPSPEETGVSTAIALIREIREEFGRGGGGSALRADWPSVGMKIVENLPTILSEGAKTLEHAVQLRTMGAAGAPPPNVNGQQPSAAPQPILQRSTPAAAVNPVAVESVATAPGELTPDQKRQAGLMLVQLYAVRAKEILVQKLFDGPDGESNTGGEVAAIAVSLMHPEYAMELSRQFELAMTGDQQQIADLQSDPILGQIFKNPKITMAMVQAFAKDFCETINERAEQEAERLKAAAPAPTPEGEQAA